MKRPRVTTIRNQTDYPDDDVDQLVRFALADLDLPRRLLARVSYTRPPKSRRQAGAEYQYVLTGHAWEYGPNGGYEISLRIARPDAFPGRFYSRLHGRSHAHDWQEALVWVTAHEGKHIENYHHGFDLGYRSHREELRCDAHAFARLGQHRLTVDLANQQPLTLDVWAG